MQRLRLTLESDCGPQERHRGARPEQIQAGRQEREGDQVSANIDHQGEARQHSPLCKQDV